MAASVQVIKRKMTLSILTMNQDKKFVFEERRSTTIPITFQERYDWIQVFELLAEFEQIVYKQDGIDQCLREENSGGVVVEEARWLE